MRGVKLKPKELKAIYRQLDLISYVDKHCGNYTVAGGWGVDGILGRITRPHKNVDVMIPEAHVETLKKSMFDYAKEHQIETVILEESNTRMPNMHAKLKDVKVDVIVLYPLCYHGEYESEDDEITPVKKEDEERYNKDYVIFETPYHTTFAPVPIDFLHGKDITIEGVRFSALNPTALYLAKLTAGKKRNKQEVARDLKDIRLLKRFVDKDLRKQMNRFA